MHSLDLAIVVGYLLLIEGTVLIGFSPWLSSMWASVIESDADVARLAVACEGVVMTILGSLIIYSLWSTVGS